MTMEEKITIEKQTIKNKTQLSVDLSSWVKYLKPMILDTRDPVPYGAGRKRYLMKSTLTYLLDVNHYQWLADVEYYNTGKYIIPATQNIKDLKSILLKIRLIVQAIPGRITTLKIKKLVEDMKNGLN